MTAEELKRLVSYDKNTGHLTWLVTRGKAIKGRRAGYFNGGALCIGVKRKTMTVARVAWLLHYGEWPTKQVEHINGDVMDCRIDNLRLLDHTNLPGLTADRLKRVLDYDPNTGLFTFKSGRRKGTITAGVRSTRRLILFIEGREYRAHRVAWLFAHGEWPSMDVDHKNGDPFDNRLDNLRLATDSQNLSNARKPSTNTSGKKGVSWHAGANKWQAHIRASSKSVYLGLFSSVEAAHAAYCEAAARLKGEFARAE